MRAEQVLYTAARDYAPTTSRWGDYGTLVGIKDGSLWYTQMTVGEDGDYAVDVFRFLSGLPRRC